MAFCMLWNFLPFVVETSMPEVFSLISWIKPSELHIYTNIRPTNNLSLPKLYDRNSKGIMCPSWHMDTVPGDLTCLGSFFWPHGRESRDPLNRCKISQAPFYGYTLQLAPSKWVLYLIKNKVGIYAVSTNELDCKELNKCCLCTNPNFHK